MRPEGIFKDKALALVVQGVLLFAAVIYTTHGGPNIFIVLCITTLLTLYVLQALNRRFRYYFPIQGFFRKNTKKQDTYILYGLTFLAFFFFLMGLTHSVILGVILSLIIVLPGPIWFLFFSKIVSSDIEKEFKEEDPVVALTHCPNCGKDAIQVGSFLEGNKAIAVGKCLKGCGIKFRKGPEIVRFG
jgi:hypothetical protein